MLNSSDKLGVFTGTAHSLTAIKQQQLRGKLRLCTSPFRFEWRQMPQVEEQKKHNH
jgi:hypothetical protein